MLKKILIGTAVVTGVGLARPRTRGVLPRETRPRSDPAGRRRGVPDRIRAPARGAARPGHRPRDRQGEARRRRGAGRDRRPRARGEGLEKKIGDGEHKVKVKNAALKSGDKTFTFAGRTYSRAAGRERPEADVRRLPEQPDAARWQEEAARGADGVARRGDPEARERPDAGDRARREHRAPPGAAAPDPGARGRERPCRPRRRRARPGQGDPRPVPQAHRGRGEDGRERDRRAAPAARSRSRPSSRATSRPRSIVLRGPEAPATRTRPRTRRRRRPRRLIGRSRELPRLASDSGCCVESRVEKETSPDEGLVSR